MRKQLNRLKQNDKYNEKVTIKFYYKIEEAIFEGKTVVANDNSILFLPDIDIGPFELYLSDWKFMIRTGSIGLYVFRYLTGYFFEEETIKMDIIIPQSNKGKVFFECGMDMEELRATYALHYERLFPFSQKCFFDANTNWLVIGDIDAKGVAIEFATNNIAVIDDENNLRAIYVKLSFSTLSC